MALFFHVGDVGDLGDRRVRLATGFSLTEYAESGTIAMSQVTVDDTPGDLTITGHQSFRVVETGCPSWETLFRGWFADRDITRGDSEQVGAARVWDCTVTDANAALQYEVIKGAGAKRPKETDTQRLAWILGSSWRGPISSSDANVLGYGVDVDKADYRGQTMADVLNDCATISGANYFVVWDYDHSQYRLHYYRPLRAYNTSSCAISNVLADVDGVTTFAPNPKAKLGRDPSRVFSGVYQGYGEKDSYVFEESSAILAAIGHKRETSQTDGAVRTAARASAKANRYLDEGLTELDTLTVSLTEVPAASVNLIRAGQRIHCTFTHLPGFEGGAYIRITKRTVQQMDQQGLYQLDLELSNPKQGGAKVRHPAVPVPPEMEDGSTIPLQRYCWQSLTERDDGHGGIPDATSFNGPGGAAHSTVSDFVCQAMSSTWANCGFGVIAWNGIEYEEQWLEFDPGSLSGVAGVKAHIATDQLAGVSGGHGFTWGIAHAIPPTADGQFTVLGSVPAVTEGGAADVFIPANQLVASTDNYLVIAPAWAAMRSVCACGDELSVGPAPIDGGDFGSGRFRIDYAHTVLTLQTMSGTGVSLWTSVEGAIDGSNRVFLLPGWNGKGTPELSIGAVVLAAGSDFSYDGDAGTVTLNAAPWAGADLRGRYLR